MAKQLDDNINYISLQNLKVSLADMSITNTNDNAQSQLRVKEAELLKYLCQRYPNVALRTDIAENVWANTYASEFTINQTVNSLRSKLFNQGKAVIITVPKRGYKLGIKPEFHTSAPPVSESLNVTPDVKLDENSDTITSPPLKNEKKQAFKLSNPVLFLISIIISVLIVLGTSLVQQDDIEAIRINETYVLFNPTENELDLIRSMLQFTHYNYIDKVGTTIYGCEKDKQCVNITP